MRRELDRNQRQRIIRATAELVAKRGYHGATTDHIVKRAHVGYTTLNKHFDSKEACFLALLDQVADDVTGRMAEAFAAAEGEWPEQIEAALHVLFAAIAEEPLVARACLVESLTAGPTVVASYERALGKVAPLLRQGRDYRQDAGQLPTTLEDTLTNAVVWMVYQRLVVGEVEQLDKLLPEALEFVLRPYLGEDEAAQIARRPRARVA